MNVGISYMMTHSSSRFCAGTPISSNVFGPSHEAVPVPLSPETLIWLIYHPELELVLEAFGVCSLQVLMAIHLTFSDLGSSCAGARQIQVATNHVEDEQRLVYDCQRVLACQERAEEESRSLVTVRKTSWVVMVRCSRYCHSVADLGRTVLATALVPGKLERNIQCRSSAEELVETEDLKLEVVVVQEGQKRCAGLEDAHLCQKLL